MSATRARLRRAASFAFTIAVACVAFAVSVAAPARRRRRALREDRARHRRARPDGAARRPARCGAAAGVALAGRGHRGARRAPRLSAGLGLRDASAAASSRRAASAADARSRRRRPNCSRSCASCATRPAPESLGIGFAAAYLQAAPAEALRGEGGAEAFDAIGTMADRLAQRASTPWPARRGRSADAREAALVGASGGRGTLWRRLQELRARRRDAPLLRRRGVSPRAGAAVAGAAARPRRARPDPRRMHRPAAAGERAARLDEWRADVLDRVEKASCPAT